MGRSGCNGAFGDADLHAAGAITVAESLNRKAIAHAIAKTDTKAGKKAFMDIGCFSDF